jgi:hypothetical protein
MNVKRFNPILSLEKCAKLVSAEYVLVVIKISKIKDLNIKWIANMENLSLLH